MKKAVFFLFFFLYTLQIKAAIFIVTANADAGAGTLREAISLANGNGSASTDYIYFNLPGTTRADVSILLETALPILTSNILIDGTTQPLPLLGSPFVKIALVKSGADYYSGLRLDNASNIEIYGLSFSNFKSDPLGAVDDNKAGIYLYNSQQITIGAPLKSNSFSNNYAGILSPFVIPRFDNVSIKISSNLFGLGENGLVGQANELGVDISFLNNSVIGGTTSSEGNVYGANNRAAIALAGAAGDINISNNKIGFNINLAPIVSAAANGLTVNGGAARPLIKNNIIAGQLLGIYLDFVNGGFKLEGNAIGTGPLGTENYGNATGVHVRFCNNGMIGGNLLSQGNNIAYNKTGVLLEIAYPITMLKNSFYCNSTTAITYKNLPEGKVITPSRISTITANSVSGVYLPNAKIELFYTDSCPDCQGKIWFATLPTDADGSWIYNGPVNGKVTSMGTNQDGATSTFSKPMIIDASVVKTGVVCGGSTGSIAVDVYDASVFEWYNAANQLVGNGRTLSGITAGTYYLKAGQAGACDVRSVNFTIDASSNGINDVQKIITNDYCGLSKGSITQILVANNLTRTWYNANNQIVSSTDDLTGVPAGTYYFKAGLGNCEVRSANYTVANINISYRAKTVSLVPATCGKGNGSISMIAYVTDEPDRFEWYDSAGNVISTEENLKNFPPGKYSLKGYGNNDCENLIGEFEILASPLPTIDYTLFRQYLSCDGKTVSTDGLVISGTSAPYKFDWLTDDGKSISNTLNLSGVEKQNLSLLVTDKNGCVVHGQTIDFTLLSSTTLEVPNAITPNGDGVNDYWAVEGAQNYPLADFSIFGRNGNLLFYSKGYVKPFTGLYNGKALPTGVYYYVIDLKTSCGAITGSITILR